MSYIPHMAIDPDIPNPMRALRLPCAFLLAELLDHGESKCNIMIADETAICHFDLNRIKAPKVTIYMAKRPNHHEEIIDSCIFRLCWTYTSRQRCVRQLQLAHASERAPEADKAKDAWPKSHT